jgi:hypothetical protein
MLIVGFSSATGGLSADILQLFASQTLGFSAAQIGAALALMLISIPFQLAAPKIVRALGFRTTMRVGYASALVLLGGLAVLPEISNMALRYVCFVGTIVAIEIVISCSWGSAWHAWMQRLTTRESRPAFLSAMRSAAQTFNVAITFGFALIVGAQVTALEYRLLLGVLGLALVLSISLMGFMSSPPVDSDDEPTSIGIVRTFLRALRNERVRVLYLLVVVELFILMPLMPLFQSQVLGFPSWLITALIGVRALVGIVASIFWGKGIRRWGGANVIRICTIGMCLTSVLLVALCFTGSQTIPLGWPLVVVAIATLVGGLSSAGYATSMIGLWYDNIDPAEGVEQFTLQDILNSSRTQLSFLTAGIALSVLGGLEFAVGAVGSLNAFSLYLLLPIPGTILIWRLLPILSPSTPLEGQREGA